MPCPELKDWNYARVNTHFHDVICNQRFRLVRSAFLPGDKLVVGACLDPTSSLQRQTRHTTHGTILQVGPITNILISLSTFATLPFTVPSTGKVDWGNSGKTFFAATYLHVHSADSYQTWKLQSTTTALAIS